MPPRVRNCAAHSAHRLARSWRGVSVLIDDVTLTIPTLARSSSAPGTAGGPPAVEAVAAIDRISPRGDRDRIASVELSADFAGDELDLREVGRIRQDENEETHA